MPFDIVSYHLYFVDQFVTDYGKDNLQFSVKKYISAKDSRVCPRIDTLPLLKDES